MWAGALGRGDIKFALKPCDNAFDYPPFIFKCSHPLKMHAYFRGISEHIYPYGIGFGIGNGNVSLAVVGFR